MKTPLFKKAPWLFALALFLSLPVTAQTVQPAQKQVIYAVLDNGRTLEPIAYFENGKLESAIDGGQDEVILHEFHTRYFKPKSSYPLVFGGTKAGTITITESNPALECERHTAKVSVTSDRAKLKGNVMALATNIPLKTSVNGTRRAPTTEERLEIESLVRKEFAKQKFTAAILKTLKSQNLTALDVDNNGTAELVGSYWISPTAKSRTLMFFIAEKDMSGKYKFGFEEHGAIDEEGTMSGDITTVDSGVLHELLLDVLDYDGDGTGEVFTYSPSFEGNGFNVYRRQSGRWVRVFEAANYRCGY